MAMHTGIQGNLQAISTGTRHLSSCFSVVLKPLSLLEATNMACWPRCLPSIDPSHDIRSYDEQVRNGPFRDAPDARRLLHIWRGPRSPPQLPADGLQHITLEVLQRARELVIACSWSRQWSPWLTPYRRLLSYFVLRSLLKALPCLLRTDQQRSAQLFRSATPSSPEGNATLLGTR